MASSPQLGLVPDNKSREMMEQRVRALQAAGPQPVFDGRCAPVVNDSDDGWLKVDHRIVDRVHGDEAGTINFKLNGQDVTIDSSQVDDPLRPLADYLRYGPPRLTGTKIGCGEGGCGACTVMLGHKGAWTMVNSCMRPVLSLDGKEVITVEGLPSAECPSTLASHNGTQCGFCSPGMVMSMYGALQRGAGSVSASDMENAFQGNLCRCTGYRPILEAAQSFVKPGCGVRSLPPPPAHQAPRSSRLVNSAGTQAWFNCSGLEDLFATMQSNPDAKLICSNTSIGVVKYYEDPTVPPSVHIHVGDIPELNFIRKDASGWDVGAAVSLSKLATALDDGLADVSRHLRIVANWQVRDVGSWAGNLMIAAKHANFPSDAALLLITLGATLTLKDSDSERESSVEDFLAAGGPNAGEILYKVHIPVLASDELFASYKVMKRHVNTHAEVNAGFWLKLSSSGEIVDSRLTFGHLQPHYMHAPNTLAVLAGKKLSVALLEEAMPVLREECSVSPDEYLQNLAVSLFYKLGLTFILQRSVQDVDPSLRSICGHYERPLQTGTPHFPDADPAVAPVGQAMPKVEGLHQTSGTADFTSDDLPADTIFGAPVLAPMAGRINSVDVTDALAVAGAGSSYISASDLKAAGASNTVSVTGYTIFASTTADHPGQFVGLVCAASYDIAVRAARLVKVNMTSAVARGPLAPHIVANSHVAETPRNMDLVEDISASGCINSTGQKHFFMETNVALCRFEDGGLIVRCSTQAMLLLKHSLGMCFSGTFQIEAKVKIENVRVGGAFGGKNFAHVPAAAAGCVAAKVLGKPVLVALDRNTDMEALGGRPPISSTFTVGASSDGKITSMNVVTNCDAGTNAVDLVFPVSSTNAYSIAGANIKSNNVTSALPHNTIMRAPGHFQGAFVTEACVEAAATQLGNAGWSLSVQEANMDSDVLNGAWAEMKAYCKPEERLKSCQAFNALNRYRKQGMYCMPCLYSMDTRKSMAKTIVTVNSDATVTIDSSGIEMGQGINTKVIQACAMSLAGVAQVDVSQISTVLVKSTDNFGLCTPTWSSTTSENCVRAVMRATDKIVKKMTKYAGSGKTWAQVVAECTAAGVKLSDIEGNSLLLDGGTYPIAGACMTHVEIDVLTGETEVLDAQIFYDCGKSLNPAVDIGQVEGCFIQGLGFSLTEKLERDSAGRLLANGTWNYRLPTALDVPHNMEVHFLDTSNGARGNVLGSKASGEPAMLMSTCPFFAVKHAIYAARQDSGDSSWFQLDAPADPPAIAQACSVAARLGQ